MAKTIQPRLLRGLGGGGGAISAAVALTARPPAKMALFPYCAQPSAKRAGEQGGLAIVLLLVLVLVIEDKIEDENEEENRLTNDDAPAA